MKKRTGLRSELLGVTISLLIFLTGGALVAVHYHIGQQLHDQAEQKIRAAANVLVSIMERTEQQLEGRGRILVELPSLRAGLTEDRDQLEPLLQEIKAVRAANLLWATDRDGIVVASTAEYPPPGESLADRPLVAEAMNGQRALGFDLFMDDWWLLLCLPVIEPESSETIGTVTLALLLGEAYLSRVAELIGTDVSFVWKDQHFWSGGWPETIRGVVASQVTGALRQPPQELTMAQGGRLLWLARQIRVGTAPIAAQPVALLGIRLDESIIQETARAIEWIALLVIAIGALFLASSIRSITKPLKSLVADSQRVGAGDLDHRARVQGADEIATLAESFNQMVDNLRTSRDALVDAKAYADNIIHRMINSLIVVDSDGTIRSLNPATVELLGYEEGELVGQPVASVFEPEAFPFEGYGWEQFLQDGIIRNVESTYRTKHGKKIPVLFSSAVMRGDDGAIQGIVCVAQDITERKHLENLKDEFISTVSHELRTPLVSIREATSLIADGSLGSLNEEQQTFIHSVEKHTQRLIRLVKTLLDISTIESGRMRLDREAVNVAELIEQTCQAYRPAIGKRKVIRHIESAPAAYADRERILEVLGHLFINAIQYTKEDGTISVSLESRNGSLEVSVTDNGMGIPREELGKLFGKFVQPGRWESERSGGVGLGLVYCKKMIELHGGAISVESDSDKGSSFLFTLPVHTQQES